MNKNIIIEAYYRENYNLLIKIARRRVGDYSLVLAEEAVQETFSRVLRYYKTYNEADNFDSWFKRILYNCIHNIKRQEQDRGVTMKEEDEEATSQGDTILTKEILDLFGQQTPRNLEILNMYFFYGFKSQEIANLTSVSHDVVRDVVRTFRKRVRE
jgi:RNA polymerase sigma factor (sigma-70 family)